MEAVLLRLEAAMKPAPFVYLRPDTVDAALHLLGRYGEDAGGQSLVPLMGFRLVTPAFLIDINRLRGLDDVAVENGRMVVGALVRHRALERNPLVRSACPLLSEAPRHIGYPAIRTRGAVVCQHFAPTKDRTLCRESGCRGQQRGSSLH